MRRLSLQGPRGFVYDWHKLRWDRDHEPVCFKCTKGASVKD